MRIATGLTIIIIGCSSGSHENKLHEQAITLHNSIMRKADQIERRLDELKNIKSVNQDSIVALTALFNEWEADIVEVPGNDSHDHDQGAHSHSHTPAPNVTDEQMLEIQKELDVRLSVIEKRINSLKPD